MRANRRLLFALLFGLGIVAQARGAEDVNFTRDVRPILSRLCFDCHGPDAAQRKAELRLDTKAGAFADLGGHFALVAGKPDQSELFRRITSSDPDEQMPPPKTGKKLTPQQVELIRKWIAGGANWSEHWSYQPPTKPAVPEITKAADARGVVDRFIRARLQRDGLSFAPEADKVTLLRRLSLDLVGLPPTIAEVDDFLADQSADAYKRQVDRLLASPHFGERWGRLWLDAARYADSDGYEKDKSRQVWFYRDWVIKAMNADLPYDQFIVEQIAGDELPNASQDQVVATGFLRNSMNNEEGGIDPEQFRMEAMFDRMDAVGKSVLGLTIQCAQCHDHKYDPLKQEEYYRLFAFLNEDHEANVAVYTPLEQMRRSELFREMQRIEADLQHRRPDWRERMAAWERSAGQGLTPWTVVKPNPDELIAGGQKHYLLEDGSILAAGYAPTKHVIEMTVKSDLPDVTAFRLELLNDPNLPLGGPGRSILGTCALTEFTVTARSATNPAQSAAVKIVRAEADIHPPKKNLLPIYDDRSKVQRFTGPIGYAIDGDDKTAWTSDIGPHRRNAPSEAVFIAEKTVSFPGGTIFTIALSQKHGGWNSDDNQNYNLGRYRLSVTSAKTPQLDPAPPAIRAILSAPVEKRSAAQVAAIFSHWRTTVPEWSNESAAIEELWRQHPAGTSQLVLAPRDKSRGTRLLKRGDFLKPDRAVAAGVPSFLHQLPKDAPASRLTFAKWLVDRQSPTTARSIVNRVWQTYFGNGIVGTSEDLGSQSEAPTHPELLDWLAVDFMEHGWSMKRLHRQIVASATYRQSSAVSSEALARDPYNRLLARSSRMRIDAELVRDAALAASGLLCERLTGPSAFPPAPEFLFQPPASYGPKVWREATGEERYRRALYTFRYRSVPYPALQTFDAPNADFSCVRRTRSNTPLQALVTLNEPLFLECAQALGRRIAHEGGGTDAERLTFAFRTCVSRRPTADETKVLLALYEKQSSRFAKNEPAARELVGKQPVPPGVPLAQLASWTGVARVLLNLDETITKE